MKLFEELKIDGYNFSSTSDTEIILNLYLKYGEEILTKLNGIFRLLFGTKEKRIVSI